MTNPYDKVSRLEILHDEPDIQSILDKAYILLGNPIVLFDTSYKLLARSDCNATDDPFMNEIINTGTFSSETVDFFKSSGFIDEVARSEVVAVLRSSELKYDRINGKLFDDDNVQLGNISIVACQTSFDEYLLPNAEELCEIISAKMQSSEFYHGIDRVYQETIINKLLCGDVAKYDEAVTGIIEQLGLVKPYLYIAVVDTTEYDQTQTHLAYFRDLFRKVQPEYYYYAYLNNIVIIMSTDKLIHNANDCFDKLAVCFEKYGFCAGLSSHFQNIYDLDKYFRQAINALNYGIKSVRQQHVFRYDNCRLEHYLNIIDAEIIEICPPIVFDIIEYDKENKTRFLNVLYQYIMYGMCQGKTSRALGITPDELSSQIKELERRFGIDWCNGDMLCTLYMSIKLLDS